MTLALPRLSRPTSEAEMALKDGIVALLFLTENKKKSVRNEMSESDGHRLIDRGVSSGLYMSVVINVALQCYSNKLCEQFRRIAITKTYELPPQNRALSLNAQRPSHGS